MGNILSGTLGGSPMGGVGRQGMGGVPGMGGGLSGLLSQFQQAGARARRPVLGRQRRQSPRLAPAAPGRNVATFANYVGSVPAGRQISVDYMPAGGGRGQAQRAAVTLGAGGPTAPGSNLARRRLKACPRAPRSRFGAGAAALFGCASARYPSHRPQSRRATPPCPPAGMGERLSVRSRSILKRPEIAYW